jgi:DNA-binding transcriptional regulator YdaS (Cro superfamily)
MKTAAEIARRLGRDQSHIYKIKKGLRRPSPKYAKAIEQAAEGEVGWRVRDLRPDLVELIENSSK